MRRTAVWRLALILALGLMQHAIEAAAAPTPISTCTTISATGSYVLSNNLVAGRGDCLIVAADFVTVDFAGFAIIGNKSGDGVTDLGHAPPYRGIVIRNGTVENCKRGVYLSNCIWSVVEDMRIIGNSSVGITANEYCDVLENVVSGNGGDAIRVSLGIARHNLVESNGGIGIGIGSVSIVDGNAVHTSGADGIAVSGSASVSGNVSNQNKGIGIKLGFFGAGTESTITGNTADDNGGAGLSLVCPSNIIGNTGQGNAGGNLVTSGTGCKRSNNLPSP